MRLLRSERDALQSAWNGYVWARAELPPGVGMAVVPETEAFKALSKAVDAMLAKVSDVDPEHFVARQSADIVKSALELTCEVCGAVLCDVEDGDTLSVLLDMIPDHVCSEPEHEADVAVALYHRVNEAAADRLFRGHS